MAQPASSPIHVGAMTIDFLVDSDESDGSVAVFECAVPAGTAMALPHSHDGFDETIYELEGTCSWMVDGATRDLRPGESLFVARGRVHGFENRGSVDARFLAIATPGLFGSAYFKEVADVLAAGSGGPPDRAALADVMRRHGLTPATPAAA